MRWMADSSHVCCEGKLIIALLLSRRVYCATLVLSASFLISQLFLICSFWQLTYQLSVHCFPLLSTSRMALVLLPRRPACRCHIRHLSLLVAAATRRLGVPE